MNFPPTMFVKRQKNSLAYLESTNECYDPQRLAILNGLYEGGRAFEAVKGQCLNIRAIEEGNSKGGAAMRKARMKSATYVPSVGGYISFLASCVLQSQPAIVFRMKKGDDEDETQGQADELLPADKEKLDWYNHLNDHVPSLLYSRLIELIVYGRSYMSISFPETDKTYESLKDQRDSGALSGKICYGLDYCTVVDWDRDDDGKLAWVKTHSQEMARDNPWEIPHIERHTWTYITAEKIYEYQADKDLREKDGTLRRNRPWDEKAQGRLIDEIPVSGMPLTEIALPDEFCLLDSVSQLCIAIFNRDASLDFALDSSAYALLAILLQKGRNMNQVLASEMAAMGLEVGEDAKYVTPDGIVYEALRQRGIDLRQALENRIHSAALNLASRDQQGRASGLAKWRDFGPIAILLACYGDVLKNCVKNMVDHLLEIMGDADEIEYEVYGMDEFDLASLDQNLDLATRFFAIPGAPTAKKYVAGKISQQIASDAPPKIREMIRIETSQLEIPEQPPQDGDKNPASSAATSGKDQIGATSMPGAPAPTPAATSSATKANAGPNIAVQAKLKNIDPSRVQPQHDTDEKFVGELVKKIGQKGYDPKFPALVVEVPGMHDDGGSIYKALDAHHRIGASKILGLKNIPSYVISYADWTKLITAFPFNPMKLGSLDDHIELPDGRTYDQVRTDNSHTNGKDDATMAGSAATSARSN